MPRKPQLPAKSYGDAFDGGHFRFLNRKHSFAGSERWEPAGADRLWVYNLHYFQYLHGITPADGFAIIKDWMASNNDPRGPGWEPYPLSMRIREWIEWLHANPDASEALRGPIVRSVGQQTAALEAQREYHLMGNHLLENGITLCWAGLSLDGPDSERWLKCGLKVLREEVKGQVLEDGAHDERSPMYQALIAESLLRLAGIAEDSASGHAHTVYRIASSAGNAMLGSLGCFIHPDGNYALLNDSALAIAPTYSSLCRRFSSQLPSPPSSSPRHCAPWQLPDAGYFGWWDGSRTYLIFDAGPIGPDHQPGHGHADTLSFELSRNGSRVITDTGVYTYNQGEVRLYDRGTAAHNTIEIDDGDQSEVWGAFRCGRRTAIEMAEMGYDPQGIRIEGVYRGPMRKPEKGCDEISPVSLFRKRFGGGFSLHSERPDNCVRHRRSISLQPNLLRFTDQVAAPGSHTAVLRLHLAPGLTLCRQDSSWLVRDGHTPLVLIRGNDFTWRETSSPYHPEFGIEKDRPCLAAPFTFQDHLAVSWTILLL